MVDPDSVLLNHSLLVEGLDLVLLEPLVVLLVDLGQLTARGHGLLLEVVDQICDQGTHLLLLVQHRRHEIHKLIRVLRDRLWRLVNYRVEQLCDCALLKRRLQASHGVKGDAHGPDVAALVVAFLFDHFRRQAERSANDFLCLDVAVVVEQARLRHVAKLDRLEVLSQE